MKKRIRIGFGGIMLSNHSSLKIAENLDCWKHFFQEE